MSRIGCVNIEDAGFLEIRHDRLATLLDSVALQHRRDDKTALKPPSSPLRVCRVQRHRGAQRAGAEGTGADQHRRFAAGTDVVGWGGGAGFTNLAETKTTPVRVERHAPLLAAGQRT